MVTIAMRSISMLWIRVGVGLISGLVLLALPAFVGDSPCVRTGAISGKTWVIGHSRRLPRTATALDIPPAGCSLRAGGLVAGAMMGAAQGQAIKAQAGLDEVDLATAAALADASIEEGLGISAEVIEADARCVVSRVGRCPLYEAGRMLGMDNATIEAMCRAGALRYMDTMVKQWNPNFSYRLREFRSSAEGHCIEEVVLG